MSEHDRRQAAYDVQVRAKYTADQLKALQKKGHTLPGGTSYPIDDREDLENAIHAVGRGGADHNVIRRYIIGRAKAMGLSKLIPDNWGADGSLTDANSATPPGETRAQPTPEDPGIAAAIMAAKEAVEKAKAAQMGDSDNGTDPRDAQVLSHLEDACDALGEALQDQAMDQAPEGAGPQPTESKSARVPAVPKRVFGSRSALAERPLPVARIEVRMDEDGDPNVAHFSGYASVTDAPYDVHDWLGQYRETVKPGAFAKTLREQGNVPLLFDHTGYPLASTGSGTSSLAEDAHGLRNDATLDRTDGNTNTVCVQLRRGVLNSMSFSFRADKDSWNDAYDERSVDEAALYDTSIVTYPANPATTAELRSTFVDAIGREGQGLMVALRTQLDDLEHRGVPETAETLLEQALRALAVGDETMCHRQIGPHIRARTFLVAGLMDEVRKGAVLSSKNAKLLGTAVDALSGAAKAHAKLGKAHEKASTALGALADAAGANKTGLDSDMGGSGGSGKNPIMPADGAGPRSLPPAVAAARAELHRLKYGR